jgi:uncharacterized protein YaeQ
VNAKYIFRLESRDRRRVLPSKVIIGQENTETIAHVLLKLLGYVLFYRERLQIEARLDDDNIPFAPDLVQLDYELRPKLWVECGECGIAKLHKLAVKVPEAEIWIVKRSLAAAENLHSAMTKEDLRRKRYGIIGLDAAMFNELCELLTARNQLLWVTGEFDPPHLQFDFNGLWFDAPFTVLRY